MDRHSAVFLLIFSLVWSGIGSGADAYQLPFHPRDLLPLLPGSIAMPVMKRLNSAVDLLPQFVGAVSSGNDTVVWNGTCFYQNEAYMEYVQPKEEGQSGGGILHIQTSNAHSWTCLDLYVFATPYRVTWDYYFTARNHTLKIDEWSEGELDYVISTALLGQHL